MRRTDSLKKTLMLVKIEGRRRGVDRGWDDWMESLTQWTWAWVNSGNWWWTGSPGMLQSMGSQRVRHDWVTELNWMANNIEHLFMWLFAVFMSSLKCLLKFWSFFLISLMSFQISDVFVELLTLDMDLFLHTCFADIFFFSVIQSFQLCSAHGL